MTEKRISINWQGQYPPSAVQTWHSWPKEVKYKTSPLETSLGWPVGTLDILTQAFQAKLPRSVGWDATPSEAFKMAAKVYKRGVPLKGENIKTLSGSYDIDFCSEDMLKSILGEAECIIADVDVFIAWQHLFPEDVQERVILVDVSEQSKDLTLVAEIIQDGRFERCRDCCIVGGGVLSDVAGFSAALGNKSFTLIPTTLLNIIDASVGGKVGVNVPSIGKNLLGMFAFPSSVFIFPDFLQTLSSRELRAGFLESLKHAILLGDKSLFLEVDQLSQGHEIPWEILRQLIAVKADIIQKDPFELGLRASLNFGHTLGHALEAHAFSCHKELLHGEAVGIGMQFSLFLSQSLGLLENLDVFATYRASLCWQTLREVWADFKSGEDLKEFSQSIWYHILNDKKNKSDRQTSWVFVKDWGRLAGESHEPLTNLSEAQFLSAFQDFCHQS